MNEDKKQIKKKKKNDSGFYIKIDKELKRKFSIKCLENKCNMSEVIKNYMKQYIKQ